MKNRKKFDIIFGYGKQSFSWLNKQSGHNIKKGLSNLFSQQFDEKEKKRKKKHMDFPKKMKRFFPLLIYIF